MTTARFEAAAWLSVAHHDIAIKIAHPQLQRSRNEGTLHCVID